MPPHLSSTRRSVVQRIRDLSLFWKMLLPFLIAILVVGVIGTFLLVRDLAERSQAQLDTALTQRSLEIRSFIHDRELSLVESANLAANLRGMSEAVQGHDEEDAAALLQSVLALKTDVALVAVTDRSGMAVSQYTRRDEPSRVVRVAPTDWRPAVFVRSATKTGATNAAAGFIDRDGRALLAVATPICASQAPCVTVGAAIVGMDAGDLVADARGRTESGSENETGVALFYEDGRLLAGSAGPSARTAPVDAGFVRRSEPSGGADYETLYSPLKLQGERAGTLGVTLRDPEQFSSVRSAALRITLLLLAAMFATVAVGAGVSRFVLRQVRTILTTHRRLAEGDLTARAPVLGKDEHGELADGLNQMAEALEESYRTLEAKVEDRTAELERILKERTDFFAAVSHEFRTPLAVILGQAQMLSNPTFPKDQAWHNQSAEILSDAANQLLTFVNDILEIAKAESGRIDINLDDIRLGALIDSLTPAMSSLARRHGLSLSVRHPRRVPLVRADETRMKEVILNLVDNAVKYTPSGGRIEVALEVDGTGLLMSVADTGIGIPANDLDRIFEPFYRVKDSETQGAQPSSGLGLALVKRLVEAQGGTVAVRSDPGEGSTFKVHLAGAGPKRTRGATRTRRPRTPAGRRPRS